MEREWRSNFFVEYIQQVHNRNQPCKPLLDARHIVSQKVFFFERRNIIYKCDIAVVIGNAKAPAKSKSPFSISTFNLCIANSSSSQAQPAGLLVHFPLILYYYNCYKRKMIIIYSAMLFLDSGSIKLFH